MSENHEGFARRWLRLKRQAEVPAALPEAAAPPMETPPPAETIPLEDIAGWMARRVPDVWREVALRRLWVSDPAISSFVGLADYAWDFTIPGGAPGWGPMRAIDDVAKLLARAIGEPEPPREPPPSDPVVVANVTPPAVTANDEPPSPPPSEESAPEKPEPQPMRRRGGGATPV